MSIINRRNNSSRNFVERWEDLPAGDWLENDEDGTHWYLASDGRHWYSTDQGYEVWVNEEEKIVTEQPKSQGIKFSWEEDDYDDDEDEDDGVKIKLKKQRLRPDLGALPGVIGVLMALVLLSWTFFLVVPVTDTNIVNFEADDELGVASDFEEVQELNYIALGILIFIMFVSILNLLVKVWWFVMPLCLIALIAVLIHTANVSTEAMNDYYGDCDSEFYDNCGEFPEESMFTADAMISGYCGGLAFLIIGMRTLSGIMNFEYDEEEDDDDYDFYGF